MLKWKTAAVLTLLAGLSTQTEAQEVTDAPRQSEGSPARAWLGLRYEMNEDDPHPTVREVRSAGPAEQAGVLAGDLLLALDGREIEASNGLEVAQFFGLFEPGAEVVIRVNRQGQILDLPMTLGTMPGEEAAALERRIRRAEERVAAGQPYDLSPPRIHFLEFLVDVAHGAPARIEVTRAVDGFIVHADNRPDDITLESKVLFHPDMQEYVDDLSPGETVAFTVQREGQRIMIDLASDQSPVVR